MFVKQRRASLRPGGASSYDECGAAHFDPRSVFQPDGDEMAQAMTIGYTQKPHGRRATPGLIGALAGGIMRFGLIILGLLIVIAGIIIAPLPGPFGLPIAVVGMMIVLRNSMWAKRRFIDAKRRWPNWVYPFRRLMRRKPEIAPVAWQQVLRTERLVVRRGSRFIARWRRKLLRRKA